MSAVHVDWHKDLNDQTIRDYLDPEHFAALASRIGITPETTLVFYGDKSNWWACYALWVFTLFGHKDLRILNGGRDKWIAEGRPVTKDRPKYPETKYPVPAGRNDETIRAFFQDTLAHSEARKPLIDVRSPGEFRGQITHMAEYPQEGVIRGGHVPGAKSVPWKTAANDDGTFKPLFWGVLRLRLSKRQVIHRTASVCSCSSPAFPLFYFPVTHFSPVMSEDRICAIWKWERVS